MKFKIKKYLNTYHIIILSYYQMQIKFIETSAQFIEAFPEFKDQARIHKSPDIYMVGLDCEFISKDCHPDSFAKSHKWTLNNESKIAICLIQIATQDICLVIDVCKLGPELPLTLLDILQSNSWIKTGVGIDNDMKYIAQNFNLQQCNGHIDLKTFGILADCPSPSLKVLFESLDLGTLDKTIDVATRDWSKEKTTEHIKYASYDAFASYKIGEKVLIGFTHTLRTHFEKITESNEQILKIQPIIQISTSKTNYVGTLQEFGQKNLEPLPKYDTGIDPKEGFWCVCNFRNLTSNGKGRTKQLAKNDAAKEMIEKIQYNKNLTKSN